MPKQIKYLLYIEIVIPETSSQSKRYMNCRIFDLFWLVLKYMPSLLRTRCKAKLHVSLYFYVLSFIAKFANTQLVLSYEVCSDVSHSSK